MSNISIPKSPRGFSCHIFTVVSAILVYLLPTAAIAQLSLSGRVTDAQDSPVPYANIGFVGTSIGTVANENGEFTLFFEVIPNSVLRISCMGFEPLDTLLTESALQEGLHVRLNAGVLELSELMVKSSSLRTKEYGNKDEKTSLKTNLAINQLPNMNLGAAIGRKFRLGDRDNFVTQLRFFVAYSNFDSLLLRINFYEVESGKPESLLNRQPIIREVVNHRNGWLIFDLEGENIVLRGTVVAAVEWIGAGRNGDKFGVNISMPALFQTHYYRYGAQNNWKVFPNMSTSMVLVVETED